MSDRIVWKKLECSPGCVAYAPEHGFEHFSVMMSDKEERAAEALVDLVRVLESKVRVPEQKSAEDPPEGQPPRGSDFDAGLDYIPSSRVDYTGPVGVRPQPVNVIGREGPPGPPINPHRYEPHLAPPYDSDPWTGKVHTVVEMNEIARKARAAYGVAIETRADEHRHVNEDGIAFAWLCAAYAAARF